METKWRDCIVTLIDLVGVRSQAQSGIGSALMRKLHRMVLREVQSGKYSFAHAYAYNDAVLVLSYVEKKRASFQTAMRDADSLKKQIDQVQKSYAIAVKGRTFPGILNHSMNSAATPVTIIESSSWAMANCFEIEKEMKKLGIKKSWYVDGRIARKIQTEQNCQTRSVRLYPSEQERKIHVYEDYLWCDREV